MEHVYGRGGPLNRHRKRIIVVVVIAVAVVVSTAPAIPEVI